MIELIPWWEGRRCGIYQDGVNLVLSSFCCNGIYEDLNNNRSRCPRCGTIYAALVIDGVIPTGTLDLRTANAQQVVEWIGKWRNDLNDIEAKIT